MHRYFTLFLFILLVLGGGTAIGLFTLPGSWYQALAKPPFNPPNWIFGPVWSLLYIMIAIAGWRIWSSHRASSAMKIWWIALALNFVWSPVFFGLESLSLALAVILPLLAAIMLFVAQSWRLDRTASVLFLPYAAWVSFASLLNASLWWLN